MLAFARALGEFGATLFLAGNYAGITRTIPVAIYFEWMGGNIEAGVLLDDRGDHHLLRRDLRDQPLEQAHDEVPP